MGGDGGGGRLLLTGVASRQRARPLVSLMRGVVPTARPGVPVWPLVPCRALCRPMGRQGRYGSRWRRV